MCKHSCKTYIAVSLDFDSEKNIELLQHGIMKCEPEEIGIYNRDEVGRDLLRLTDDISWFRHSFELGYNDKYDVDINKMIRVTLKDLFGKQALIKEIAARHNVEFYLRLVPYIAHDSDEPTQILSLDDDIIAFLHESGISLDLDYYII